MSQQAFTIVACVNNDDVLRKNLLASPGLLDGTNELIIKRDFQSASLAYNDALDEAGNDLVIFVHQDVYLPESWFDDLKRCLTALDATDPNWGVLGCFGSRKHAAGGVGQVYTRGMGRHGRHLTLPEPIETLDEILLVVRKSSGLRFDPCLPHFHLYGTDICMAARARGLVSYAFQGYCVHNTNQLLHLPREFYSCYRYIRRKWGRYLPIYTACIKISLLSDDYYRKRVSESRERLLGTMGQAATRVDDPRVFVNERS
jgi:hypothetical protein